MGLVKTRRLAAMRKQQRAKAGMKLPTPKPARKCARSSNKLQNLPTRSSFAQTCSTSPVDPLRHIFEYVTYRVMGECDGHVRRWRDCWTCEDLAAARRGRLAPPGGGRGATALPGDAEAAAREG